MPALPEVGQDWRDRFAPCRERSRSPMETVRTGLPRIPVEELADDGELEARIQEEINRTLR